MQLYSHNIQPQQIGMMAAQSVVALSWIGRHILKQHLPNLSPRWQILLPRQTVSLQHKVTLTQLPCRAAIQQGRRREGQHRQTIKAALRQKSTCNSTDITGKARATQLKLPCGTVQQATLYNRVSQGNTDNSCLVAQFNRQHFSHNV